MRLTVLLMRDHSLVLAAHFQLSLFVFFFFLLKWFFSSKTTDSHASDNRNGSKGTERFIKVFVILWWNFGG